MSNVKNVLLEIEELNTELTRLAEEEREARVQQIFDEMMDDYELQRQFEALQHAADLENFSPFDAVNN
jgi:vacuolar-type H+-ATPase subunit I/STV1